MPTLHWIGKDKVQNHHLDVPFRVLQKQYAHGDPDSGNRIIHGDNLEALKALLPEYEGRVKCIYIDPPYNTGNEGWRYNDNVSDPRFLKWLRSTVPVGKEGEDLSRHDKWLCMMYPRLRLLHKLLADDGAIFISIDDNEQAHLRLVLDEIFGAGNFVGNVIWQHSIQGKNDAKKISLHHNHLFIYQKPSFQIGKTERSEEHNVAYSNPDNDPKGPWRSGDFRSPHLRENLKYDLITPSGKIISPPEKGWRWDKKLMAEKIKAGEVVFSADESRITRKIYLQNQEGRVVESIWFGKDVGTTREANSVLKEIFDDEPPFDTPKPSRLIERILQIATEKDSLILDSFAGSGTTAHAVLNLNRADGGHRKFILIEMEGYAETLTAERVRRVMAGYAGKAGTGGGFDFCTLGEPLFLENGLLNEAVGADEIRKYVWHAETGQPFGQPAPDAHRYFLGQHEGTAWWFCYEAAEAVALNPALFGQILAEKPAGCTAAVVYADYCTVPDATLAARHIRFKKIPRDIPRL